MSNMKFTFSDTIAGYISDYKGGDVFSIKTADGREFEVKLSANLYAETVRNLGDDYSDCTGQIKEMLQKDRYLFAYGIFYPEQDFKFEAKHIVFLGKEVNQFRFEEQDWWIKQIKHLADFYLKAEFGNGEVDFKKYRTMLTLYGDKFGDTQEIDTMSRYIYGFASAYMMTGDDRYLEVAEKGTRYLHDHCRNVNTQDNTVVWDHLLEADGDGYKEVIPSRNGDDLGAIPAYEQIYAVAGPTQTYRISGNPEILQDIDMTINLFDKYFLDKEKGGYFSHLDPENMDPRSEGLGGNRARKNWNSVGDHAPAYLINLCLATGQERYKAMLKETADTITGHFQDYENSPFVQEKFFEDWSHDKTWGWQQNRAVVGHNLKIAWNLMRINNVFEDKAYVEFAKKIASLMPQVGCDLQRGGWYDVVDRVLGEGEEFHRFAWHDRKAWWQQEQGILAYLILAGVLKDPEYLKLARESNAFYNTWFLDHDSEAGGVYFNVLANGLPYLLGTERTKGSHSMACYHAFELAYLGAVYTNLLVTGQPMDFYFKPVPNGFKDNILRVQPDMLPKGSVKIDKVTIDGEEYSSFDAEELLVFLPQSDKRVTVKVTLAPVK